MNDITHHNIYRSESKDGPWDESTFAASVLADGSEEYEYADSDKGEPDGIYWWYVVRAVALHSQEDLNTDAVQEPADYYIKYGRKVFEGSGMHSWTERVKKIRKSRESWG